MFDKAVVMYIVKMVGADTVGTEKEVQTTAGFGEIWVL